jgi:hypothetical protein
MALKHQRWLPKIILTTSVIEAFVDEDVHTLQALLDWKPWEYSPLDRNLGEPLPGQVPHPRSNLRQKSWWCAVALREKLTDLARLENIKPSRAAQLRKARVNRLPNLTPDPASNFDPLERRVWAVVLAPSELVGVAETARVRVVG